MDLNKAMTKSDCILKSLVSWNGAFLMVAGVVCDTCTHWLQCTCRQSFIFVWIVLVSTPTERSWPPCLVWTSTLIKQTSHSNTRHQSSPEKALHQVKDVSHGHLWFTGTFTSTLGYNSNMSCVCFLTPVAPKSAAPPGAPAVLFGTAVQAYK